MSVNPPFDFRANSGKPFILEAIPQADINAAKAYAESLPAAPVKDVKGAEPMTDAKSNPSAPKTLPEWLAAAKLSKQCVGLGIAANVDVLTTMFNEYAKLAARTEIVKTKPNWVSASINKNGHTMFTFDLEEKNRGIDVWLTYDKSKPMRVRTTDQAIAFPVHPGILEVVLKSDGLHDERFEINFGMITHITARHIARPNWVSASTNEYNQTIFTCVDDDQTRRIESSVKYGVGDSNTIKVTATNKRPFGVRAFPGLIEVVLRSVGLDDERFEVNHGVITHLTPRLAPLPAIKLLPGRLRAMTVNLLALINSTPVFYPGCNMSTLWNLSGRLDTVGAWIAKMAPHAIAFQEADQPAIDYLSALLGKSYKAGEFAPDADLKGDRLVSVGCVVFVHKDIVSKSSIGILDARGLARADIEIPGLPSARIIAYKIGFKENGLPHIRNVMRELWETEFKDQKIGFLGTDSNMPADVFAGVLAESAPAFSASLRLDEHKSATFLHCEDLKKCGAIDAVVHLGFRTEFAKAPLSKDVSRSFPVFALPTPTSATELPKACEAYQALAGSDHVPVVCEIIMSKEKEKEKSAQTAAAAAK